MNVQKDNKSRRKNTNWAGLFLGNFFGVLNDNFLKHSIIFIATAWTTSTFLNQSQIITLVSAALILPYLIFSPLAGKMAVLYSKQRIFRICKIAEFPIVGLACWGFYMQSIGLLIFTVLLMGIQSCIYSPCKYGLIRDIGGQKGIAFGSGMFEMMSFLAILSGAVVASKIADEYSYIVLILLLLSFAAAGYTAVKSIKVNETESENAHSLTANPFLFFQRSMQFAAQYKYINCSVLGVSAFWLIGSLVQMNLINHCTLTLHTTNTQAGVILALTATGIAVGCFLAGKISGKTIRPRLIFAGISGMIVLLLVLLFFNPTLVGLGIICFFTALAGGFFEVPCLALLQYENTGRQLGNMLAYMNFCNFIFILIGSGLFALVTHFSNQSSIAVFWLILGLCVAILLYFLIKYPHFLKKNWQK